MYNQIPTKHIYKGFYSRPDYNLLEMTGTKVEPKALRKVFVGGLNLKTTEETFKDHFNQFGELVDCVVMTDPYTKKSRGFGFIEFSTADQVDA